MNEQHDSMASDEPVFPERAAVRWARLVRQQRDSGLSVKTFCAQHGLTASSLFAWRRKLTQPSSEFTAVKIVGKSAGAEILVDAPVGLPCSDITLCLPGGRRLLLRRGFDRQLLLDLLDVLDGSRGAS